MCMYAQSQTHICPSSDTAMKWDLIHFLIICEVEYFINV